MSSNPGSPVAGDASERYAHPEDILNDPSLTREKKIDVLHEWDQDLRQLMVASEENMQGTQSGQAAESLQAVTDALSKLGIDTNSKDASPAKSGTPS